MQPKLTIRELRATAVSVPMKRPLGTSALTISTAPLVLIDLITEEGITGRAYLFSYVPAASGAILKMLAELSVQIKGDTVVPLEIGAKLQRSFRLIGLRGIVTMALAGLDAACWDALALAANLPLASLLGGTPKPLPVYNSNGLGLIPIDQVGPQAAELVAEGFRAIKLRLGRPTLQEDLQAVRAARSAIADDVALMVDFNQALSLAEALKRGRAIDQEGVYWIEEPIRHDDYVGYATLSRELSAPVQFGENFQGTHAMADAIAANAGDYMMPDLERIGGVSGWMRAAALAHAAGIEVSSHLFPEVSAHLMAATPTAHWLEYVDWANPILAQPLVIRDGFAHVSTEAGSGLSWNDEAVARYRVA